MKVIKEEVASQSVADVKTVELVSSIINEVRSKGDEALRRFTREFDKFELGEMRLSQQEIDRLVSSVDAKTKEIIDTNVERVKKFAEFQRGMYRAMEMSTDDGETTLGQRIVPLRVVGVYVPAGRYPLLSSAIMGIIPARMAGVEKVVVATPPGKGRPHPATVYGMVKAGASEIYTVGGAQAIAAMALGTQTVPKVDKIVGPGNKFVNEAKRQLFGHVGIDLLAGPSEVLVFADDSAKLDLTVYDLLAQAEHDVEARACLVTTSERLAREVNEKVPSYIESLGTKEVLKLSWAKHGQIVLVNGMDEGIDFVNGYGPEHLELHMEPANLERAVAGLRNYGSLFVGEDTPVVFSDKLIGTNHILPTAQASKYTGGLNVGAFLKILTYQNVKGINSRRFLATRAAAQSHIEMLDGHAKSAELRT